MRDCLFLLADSNMQGTLAGFLSRDLFHRSLGCGSFMFDPAEDLVVAAGDNDPGLYVRGHELLRPFQRTHQHALVVIDAAWDGSPGAETIRADMTANVRGTGWPEGSFRVVVIDPELEVWVWQQNQHVARALGFASEQSMMANHRVAAAWPAGQNKPSQPKETLEAVLRQQRIPRSSSIYRQITERISVRGCHDLAFQQLREALQTWFREANG